MACTSNVLATVATATAMLFIAITMAPRWTEAQELPPMPKVTPGCALAKLPDIIQVCYLSGNLMPSDKCCNDLKSASTFQMNCLCDNFIADPANANFTRPLFDVVHTACGVLDKYACTEAKTPRGPLPSYAWISLLYGRELLLPGLRTIIGNGVGTRVWFDTWLFDDAPCQPMFRMPIQNLDLRVCELMLPSQKEWNLDKINETFFDRDRRLVLKHNPCPYQKDGFCWTETKSGLYTVSSGYAFMNRRQKLDLYQAAEASPSLRTIYYHCRAFKTPPKIKNFLWKATKGALAVSDRLKTRGINTRDGCLACECEDETVNHILFECPLARQVWALSNVPLPCDGFASSIFANIHYLAEMAKNKEIPENIRHVAPWIMWILWKNRNKLLFEGISFQAPQVVNKAFEDAHQWREANRALPEEKTKWADASEVWLPPLTNRVKCNIGFSWHERSQMAGVSWVLRETSGKVLMHSRRSYGNISSVYDAKVKAWEWALESMKSLKQVNVTFASTSMELVKQLHKPREWPLFRSILGNLLELTKDQVGWELCFENKKANKGAFEIARSVTRDNRPSSYVARGEPSWLRELFFREQRRI